MKILQVKTHKSYIIKKRSNNIKWHNVGLNCGSAVRTIAPLFSNRNFRASRIVILTWSCPNSTRPWSLADERITPCNHTLSFPSISPFPSSSSPPARRAVGLTITVFSPELPVYIDRARLKQLSLANEAELTCRGTDLTPPDVALVITFSLAITKTRNLQRCR